MKRSMTMVKRVAIGIVGTLLVVAGLVFVPLPIVPGWAVVILGLVVLSTEFDWARHLLENLKSRLERFRHRRRSASSADVDEPDLRLTA